MKVLMTRHKEDSLGYYIQRHLERGGCEVTVMQNNVLETFDFTNLGSFDRVINLAGKTLNQPISEFDCDESEEVILVNLLGAMNLTAAYAKHRHKGGVIFHTGSIGGRKVMTNCSAYSASKAGLDHYVHCAGYELKKQNIYVVGIDPCNLLGTPMTVEVQRGLVENRGMSQEQVDKIYADAGDTERVGKLYADMVMMGSTVLELLSGENIILGKSDHR